jgi:hypothetical protein
VDVDRKIKLNARHVAQVASCCCGASLIRASSAELCTHLSLWLPMAVAWDMVEWCECWEKAGCPPRPLGSPLPPPGSRWPLMFAAGRVAEQRTTLACSGRSCCAAAAAGPSCICRCWRLRRVSVGKPPSAASACVDEDQDELVTNAVCSMHRTVHGRPRSPCRCRCCIARGVQLTTCRMRRAAVA